VRQKNTSQASRPQDSSVSLIDGIRQSGKIYPTGATAESAYAVVLKTAGLRPHPPRIICRLPSRSVYPADAAFLFHRHDWANFLRILLARPARLQEADLLINK